MEQDTRRSIRSHLRIRLQDHNPNADFKREQARKAVRRNREQHTEEQKVIVRNLDRDRSKKRRAMMSEEEKEKVRAQTRIRQQRYMANKRSLAAAATKAGVLPKTSIRAPVYMTRNEQQEIHAKLATTRLMCLKRQRRCRAKWSAQKKRRINEKRRQKYRDKKEAERLRKSGQGKKSLHSQLEVCLASTLSRLHGNSSSTNQTRRTLLGGMAVLRKARMVKGASKKLGVRYKTLLLLSKTETITLQGSSGTIALPCMFVAL